MSPHHFCHFFILIIGVNSFILFIYICYYSDLLKTKFCADLEKVYDYIIVGSGTSGSTIAYRIASETNLTFIVLEAGGRSNSLLEIPVLGPLLHGSFYDWNYETVHQENVCLAMNNNKCRLTQGKIVGGSSKLNNMIHIRGNISIYIDWFHGKYKKDYITSHFNFIENNVLHLNEMQYDSELATAVLEAAKELGLETQNTDFNAGFSKVKLSQNNGKRWTISDKLDISKYVIANAFVDEIIINDKETKGVIVNIAGKTYKTFATKGVILTAGTYNTPKILQLSGIGPSEILTPLNIPIVKELPVGKNLQDHVTTGFDLILFNKSLTVNPLNMLNIINVLDYFVNGKGPLTTAGCEVVGFLSSIDDEKPDLQFMVMPVGISADKGAYLRLALGINNTVWNKYFENIFNKHAATILPIVLHPKSKGELYITSKDSKIQPSIYANYLSNREDVRTLIEGLKIILKFVNTSAMKKIGAFINPQHFPGCENFDLFSDLYWECYVRHLTLTTYHPIGTCSMGVSSADSVVDTSFKVFGVSNLYIADASVLPTMPSGNINAAVAMMASVFFDEIIKSKRENLKSNFHCHKNDLLFEYVKRICI